MYCTLPYQRTSSSWFSRISTPSSSHLAAQLSTVSPSRSRGSKTILTGCDPETLYTYSAQKWLWDERAQLQRRYIQFNLDVLIRIAEEAAGQGHDADAVCVNLTKLPGGNFNKTFLATMRDGKQLIVKIPNTNAGPVHYTTASEVATMQIVREHLDIPVPKVLGYCSMASKTPLGAEYIVMEKAPGVELARVWESLKGRQKLSIVNQIAGIGCALAQCHGALYRRQDVSLAESIVFDDDFAIGPTVGRA
ncbi:kinase-like domain-containing protein [Aspergillus varians]